MAAWEKRLHVAARELGKAAQQFATRCKAEIYKDAGKNGAKDALCFLAQKAECKEEDLILDFFAILRPYSCPPVRSRLPEARRMESLATDLRQIAAQVRSDRTCGLNAGVWTPNHAPRGSKAWTTVPDMPISFLRPELERLPEMLENYASCLEDKAHSLRRFAKREPTEKQHWRDRQSEAVKWVQHLTRRDYYEKVTAIMRVMNPLMRIPAPPESETLRRRTHPRKRP